MLLILSVSIFQICRASFSSTCSYCWLATNSEVVSMFVTMRLQVLTVVSVLQYAGAFFAGMLPYAYLHISDKYFPQPMSWGDCSTLTGFFKHFVRAGAGGCDGC